MSKGADPIQFRNKCLISCPRSLQNVPIKVLASMTKYKFWKNKQSCNKTPLKLPLLTFYNQGIVSNFISFLFCNCVQQHSLRRVAIYLSKSPEIGWNQPSSTGNRLTIKIRDPLENAKRRIICNLLISRCFQLANLYYINWYSFQWFNIQYLIDLIFGYFHN